MSYAKLDSEIIGSSLCAYGPDVVGCWSIVLSQEDQFGITSASPRLLQMVFAASGMTREDAERIWAIFTSPDPESKSKTFEGRRLIPSGDGRWVIVTHDDYAKKHRAEARQSVVRQAVAKFRAREHRDLCQCGSEATSAIGGKLLCDECASRPE